MADYHSNFTAPEIDAALARAKAGGEIDTLLQNKAPSGYGLGESQGRHVENVSVDTLTKNGWYYLYDGVTGGPSGYSIYHATLFVSSSRSDLTKVQRLILATSGLQGYELRRVYNDTAWLPWEWVNPPMAAGVEYRTTERYHGKPVYCKLVDFGNLPNNTYKNVAHGISNLQLAISVSGESNGDNLIGNMYITYVNIGSTNIRIKTNADRSGVSATVLIKYTKTID